MKQYVRVGCVVTLCLMFGAMPLSAQVFVVPGGAGNEDGTSWENAYADLQTALEDERAGEEDVWVAGGVYELSEVIIWPQDIAGYGGFAGDEDSLEARDFVANETILDANEVSRVIRCEQGVNRRIDGFTITGGVNEPDDNSPGPPWSGGLHLWGGPASNVVANCWVVNNNSTSHAGGVFVQDANWTFENNIFENNSGNLGGAMFINGGAAPTINNCMFIENSSTRGAVVSRVGSSPTITNSVFINNQDSNSGSAVQAQEEEATATIDYCTFYGNVSAGDPPSVIHARAGAATVNVSNSIIWGNEENVFGGPVDVSNSIVQGGAGGGIDDDPLFVDADAEDLRLASDSPAIGIGSDWPDTDIVGNERPHPQGTGASIGAYEYDGLFVSINGPSDAVSGEDVQFILEHNAQGDVDIVWEKDGEVLDGEVFEALLLSDISEDDAGVYTVNMVADNGEVSASTTLNVVAGLPLYSPLALLILAFALAFVGIFSMRRARS